MFMPFPAAAMGIPLLPLPIIVFFFLIVVCGTGAVPHVFGVVEPHPKGGERYRLAFFQRPTVGEYDPPSPPASYSFIVAVIS